MTRQSGPRRGDLGVARTTLLFGVAGAVLAGSISALAINGAFAGSDSARPLASIGGPRQQSAPARPAVVSVALRTRTGVPWSSPLTLAVSDGALRSVLATGPDGPLPGRMTATGWTSTSRLLPSTTYRLTSVVVDAHGTASSVTRTATTQPPVNVLHATLSPSGDVVGVGAPVIVTFDQAVKTSAARAAVLKGLTVTSVPAVAGAWRWMDSYEVHYRGPSYWAAGTKVTVNADLRRLNLPGTGTWGTTTKRTASFSIGDAVVSTVDVTAHTMTVRRNGEVLKAVNVSTGRDKYPTKGGAHIVLLKEKEHLYDSSTVGIPIKSPDGYLETLPWSVRISNGGAFVHANPATVRFQGRVNVSHGCINLSLDDAAWYFGVTRRGDVVDVIHAAVGPNEDDAGMQDWNMPFSQWKTGNL